MSNKKSRSRSNYSKNGNRTRISNNSFINFNGHEGEQDDREFEIANEHVKKFDPAKWKRSMSEKQKLSVFTPGIYQPDDTILMDPKFKTDVGVFVGVTDKPVTVKSTKNPIKKNGFGFIGVFATVLSNSTFIPGTLIIKFDRNNLGRVAHETLRLFRWDENLQSFQKVFNSGLGKDYVWGEITLPGIYAIIGSDSNPIVIRTAKVLAMLGDLMSGLSSEMKKRLQEKICNLLLNSRELSQAIRDPTVVKSLNQESAGEEFPDPIYSGEVMDIPRVPDPPVQFQSLAQSIFARSGLLKPIYFDVGWSNVGPSNISGCIYQVAIDPVDAHTIYAAAADGGLWRLNDVTRYPAVSWIPLTDQNESLIIRAFAIAPNDTNVIYIADGLGHLLRSDDRGRNWILTSGKDLGYVRKIIVNPRDKNDVYVGSGHYRPDLASGEGGFWRSKNGGAKWEKKKGKYKLFDGDVTDAIMDPDNSSIIYIGVRNEGLYKSKTSGDSWTLVLPWSKATAPVGSMIKVAIGHVGSDASRMVAVKFDQEIIVNHMGGRASKKPGVDSWVSKGKWGGDGQGDWDHVIAIDPFNDDVILAGAQSLFRNLKGGDGSWDLVAGYDDPRPWITHPDQQSIIFDTNTKRVIYISNDGGVFRSNDWGSSWQDLNKNLTTGQFYDIGVSNNAVIAGMYHQGVVTSYPLMRNTWLRIEGGGWEFSNVYADPVRVNTFYIFAYDQLWRRFLLYRPDRPMLIKLSDFAPTAIAVDTRDRSNTLLAGSSAPGRIMRALDGDKDIPTWDVEPGINIGAEPIVSISFAPSKPGMAYAVSSSGVVFRKKDVNTDEKWERMGNWTEGGIRHIAVNALHEDRIYLMTLNKVARSEKGGKNWIEIPGTGKDTLPNSEFNSLVTHRYDGKTIFLSADIGVFITTDEGQHWSVYDENLPNAEVVQLVWSGDYLYASTHGRGIWRRLPYL